jgi:hypothetical protein
MSEKTTKNRIITVRITDEEYETLRATTQFKGYRNVSELARAAMHTVAGEQLAPHQVCRTPHRQAAEHLATLCRDLDQLVRVHMSVSPDWKRSE